MAEQRKRELVAQLAIARSEITVSKTRISHEMNLGRQLKKSFQSHPLGWFAGTMGAATLLGVLGRRRVTVKQPRKRFRTIRWLFGIGFTLVKPTLTALVINRAKEEAEKRLGTASLKSMLGGPSQK
jgi:hypothetical protein